MPLPLRLATLLAAAALAAPALGALEEFPCRLQARALPAAFAECAMLAVPVDYADPSGPALELAVARIPALTATPAPDPLVLINGGPGGSGIDLYLQARAAFEPVRRDRDIVLVDQRGTGRSRAGLACEIPGDLALETAGAEELRAAVERCRDAVDADPRFFTTSVAVRDLEAVRRAYGAAQWNIYGISYGTRVAQHYLRLYPQHVRSVILDGVVPAELVLGPDSAGNAQASLDRVLVRCARAPACAERFGALDEKFAALRARFAAAAVGVEIPDPRAAAPVTRTLGEAHFQAVVRLMSYAAPTIALLPLVIDEAYAGNYAPLAAQAGILIESLAESLSFPMHNSVVCAEDAPYFRRDATAERGDYLGNSIVASLTAICAVWPRGVRDDTLAAAVESAVPALLLSGELDPVTPPEYAERVAAAGLSNARHLVAPGHGHGIATVGCVPRLMRDFLAAAEPAALDGRCLEAEAPMPFFLGFHGPAP